MIERNKKTVFKVCDFILTHTWLGTVENKTVHRRVRDSDKLHHTCVQDEDKW